MGPITVSAFIGLGLGILSVIFGGKGRQKERQILRGSARQNKQALAQNLARCTDECGTIDSKAWTKQADRFMRSVAFKPRKISRGEARKIVTVVAQAELNYGHM